MRKECDWEGYFEIDPKGRLAYDNKKTNRRVIFSDVSWERCDLKRRREFDESPMWRCALDWCAEMAKEEVSSGSVPFAAYCLVCERLIQGNITVEELRREVEDSGVDGGFGMGDKERVWDGFRRVLGCEPR